MNPVVGDALEAAREAEAALQALEHAAKVARGDTGEEDDSGNSSSSAAIDGSSAGSGSSNSSAGNNASSTPGPIHRVEIEAAELVPSHTGRAQRGFVARIHRHASNAGSAQSSSSVNGNANSSVGSSFARNYPSQGAMQQGTMRPAPETHVFSNHNDLTNFLHDQFAQDSK
jgi:hypothetical protein